MFLYLFRLEFVLVLVLSTILVLSFSSNSNNYYFCQAQLSNGTNSTNSTTSSPGTAGNETGSAELTTHSTYVRSRTAVNDTTTVVTTAPITTTTIPTSTTEETTSPPTTTSTSTTSTTTSTTTTTSATTSTTTVTTTTTTTLPTRGPPPAQLQTGVLPAGMVRIRPGALITSQQVVELADSYLRKQQPFVLPLDLLPQNWNFTTNISSVEDNGWSIILTFTVVDLAKTYIPTAATASPPTTTPAMTPRSSPTATSATTGKGSASTSTATATTTLPATDSAILSEEQLIANALARVLSDACNVRHYHPPSFTGYFEACTGRPLPFGATTEEDYASGDWSHRPLPIPRQARDPTNSAASTIPEWALVLGCIAAAILGWAIGMLVAFAACPKLPYKSLKDRLLDDEDEIEKELGDIVRAKVASLCGRVGGGGGGNRDDDNGGLLKQQEMQETFLPSPAFMTSPQRQQHYDGDAMDLLMNRKNKNSKKGKGNYSRHEEL